MFANDAPEVFQVKYIPVNRFYSFRYFGQNIETRLGGWRGSAYPMTSAPKL